MAKLEPPTDAFAPPGCRPCPPGVGWGRAREIRRRGEPPGRGDFWILKVTQGPFPESAARFDFGQVGAPRPLGDVASFGDDTPIGIRTPARVRFALDLPDRYARLVAHGVSGADRVRRGQRRR